MSEINTLQEVINKRAGERLDADLLAIGKFISENRILSMQGGMPYLKFIMSEKTEHNSEKTATQHPLFMFKYEKGSYGSLTSSAYMDRVREYFLPIYIREETEMFIKKIDEMQENIEYLTDKTSDL